MNYVNIYGKSFSNDDKEKVLKLMSLIDIPAGAVKFRDVDLGDMNISEKINLCFDNTYKDFAGLFIKEGVIKARDLLKGNLILPESGLMLFSIAMSIREVFALEENKDYAWEVLSQFKSALDSLGHSFSDTPKTEAAPELKNPDLCLDNLESDLPWVVDEVQRAKEVEIPKDNIKTNTPEEQSVSIDVIEVLNAIVDNMKNDATLGKSLKLMSRVELISNEGDVINIYPSNIIKASDPGTHISFKDMCSIIKMALIVDSKQIKFIGGK